MSLIVLVQAPDRMRLSWKSCFQWVVQSEQQLWGPSVDAAEPRPRQGTHSPFIRSCCASLSPNPWSRPSAARLSRKNKNYKWKTRAVKWRQLCAFNVTTYKETPPLPPLFSLTETGRLRGFTFSALDEYIFRFPRLSFSTFSRGSVPFWKNQWCSFFRHSILIAANVPQAKRTTWWFMPGLSDLKVL